jgi:hypothetical protein
MNMDSEEERKEKADSNGKAEESEVITLIPTLASWRRWG